MMAHNQVQRENTGNSSWTNTAGCATGLSIALPETASHARTNQREANISFWQEVRQRALLSLVLMSTASPTCTGVKRTVFSGGLS